MTHHLPQWLLLQHVCMIPVGRYNSYFRVVRSIVFPDIKIGFINLFGYGGYRYGGYKVDIILV